MWTWREIHVRYKQSVLGVAWAVLQPLSLMLVFTAVFSLIIRIPTGDIPYPLFSYSAVLPWSFFASSIALGVPSLVNNMNLVTKVSMPREILPIGAVLAGLLDFGVASILFVGMLIIYRVALHWTVLWVIPLLAIQFILSIGVVLLGSALNVLFRDIRFIVPLATQLWMYATPIIYPMDLIPERFRFVYYLNPMAAVIDGYRRAIVSGSSPDGLGVGIAFVVSAVLLILSYVTFKRLEPEFADII
jgi:lipopolysaccharide transport system permease protein